MRNLKDIITERLNITNNVISERLVLSKDKNSSISVNDFKLACAEYVEKMNTTKILIDDLPSFKEYKSIYDADKLPLINVEQKLSYGMLRGSGKAYLQSIEYDDGFASAPIRINYILESDFDKKQIQRYGIQVFHADMTIENFIKLFKDNEDVLIELYDYIKYK